MGSRMYSFIGFWSISFFTLANPLVPPHQVTHLPGISSLHETSFAGYLPLTKSHCARFNCEDSALFYFYVANRAHLATAPLVLWLNGGPGAASLYGFFMENGPYAVQGEDRLVERRYSWNQKANYLVIDQPVGVGFSYAGGSLPFDDEAQAMDQLSEAVNLFFKWHPELKNNPFYLAGESYAGKYIPQLAIRLLANQKANGLNLKGIMIGDGWVNPRLQQAANAQFAYTHGLIDKNAQHTALKLYRQCVKEIDKQTPSSRLANQTCEKIQQFIQQQAGEVNLANIAQDKEVNDELMIQYLNQPSVRQALHVDPRVKTYSTFSSTVAKQLEIGEQDAVDQLYPILLAAGLRVFIYNGLEDGKDSNFLSTDLWLAKLNWPYKQAFAKAKTCIWQVHHQTAGYVKTAGGLTQVKIRNAGHLAPIDQPERLKDLFDHFIAHRRLC